MDEASGVWAVVSAFNPSSELAENIDSVRSQVDGVVVVDDGSTSTGDPVWELIRARGAEVVVLAENSGIAAALNAGMRRAWERGADAVLTLDQDSAVSPGFVDALKEVDARARELGIPRGAVVPEYFSSVRQAFQRAEDGLLRARRVIQSGMLLGRDTVAELGDFDEGLFIDLVDTEYELRIRASGRVILAAEGLRLAHALGTSLPRTVFGRPLPLPGALGTVTVSTPFRYYYRVRNRRVLNRLYRRRFPGALIRDSLIELAHYANVLLLARPRRGMMRLYCAGWRAGRRGRALGRMPEELARQAREISWPPVPGREDSVPRSS